MPVPPQVWGASQLQLSVPPQPSPIVPQYLPPPLAMLQVSGTQLAATHSPPAQELPAGQSPHVSVPPQPLPMSPQ